LIRINVLVNVDFADLSYSMHNAAFWSVAEPAVAIINCCIATLRPLLKLISPTKLWSSNKGSLTGRTGDLGGSGFGKKLKNKVGLEHDEYPLTRIENGMTSTVVASEGEGDPTNGGTTWEGQGRHQPGREERLRDGRIHVQHDYSIRRQTGGSP
jgi:hypothetical protein